MQLLVIEISKYKLQISYEPDQIISSNALEATRIFFGGQKKLMYHVI